MNKVDCRIADLSNGEDSTSVVELLDEYAKDMMGGGSALSENTRQSLIKSLIGLGSSAHVFFGMVDTIPVALSICFDGFSTFECLKVLNIHDFCVQPGMYTCNNLPTGLVTSMIVILISLRCSSIGSWKCIIKLYNRIY